MESTASDIRLMEMLQQTAKVGWWRADLDKRTLSFSDYLVQLLGLKSDTVDFDRFATLANPDARLETLAGLKKLVSSPEGFDENFMLSTVDGFRWLRMKAARRDVATGLVEGIMQYIDQVPGSQVDEESSTASLDKLLGWQTSVTRTLLGLLDNASDQNVVQTMLDMVRENYGANHAYICVFDHQQRTFDCLFESVDKQTTPIKSLLKGLPARASWMEELIDKKPSFRSDILHVPGNYNAEFGSYGGQKVLSSMAAPLVSRQGVWGFIKVDLADRRREWTYLDKESFLSVSNVIGVCLALGRSEDEAHQKSDFLDSLYSNMPMGYFCLDVKMGEDGRVAEYTYIDVNDKFLEIMGRKREQLIGKTLSEVGPIYVEPLDLGILADVAFRGKVHEHREQVRHNMRYYQTVIYSPQPGNVVALFMDVHEQVMAAQAVYEASSRLRDFESAFNAAAVTAELGFFRLNPLKNESFYSDQWYRNMGLDKKVVEFEDYTRLIHPDDALVLDKWFADAVAGKEKSMSLEFRVRDTQGGWKWLRTTCSVTEYDPENGVVQLVGINYNVNEIKLAEQKLIAAKQKAEESDRLKSAFLANMSHEIRTPLNAIVGFSALLSETDDKEERKEYMAIIEKNNQHLLNLISDILDLSKIEAGTIEISLDDMHVDDLCSQVVRSFYPRVPAGVELRFLGEGQQRSTIIKSDAKRINQVLSNFVSNALKFTSEGHVWLDYEVADGMITFRVGDTGIGMTPEQAATVFDRFVKINDFIPGTGLGLAICRSIAERMGGAVGVDSEKGKGSSFWFTVPV